MTIHELKNELKAYLPIGQIDKKIKEIRKQRKWNDKYFENEYVKRCLFRMLQVYKESVKNALHSQ